MCCSRQRLLPQCGCERLASAAIAVWAPGGEGCANADEHSFSARRPPSSALAAAATTDHAAIDAAAAGLNKIATLSILAVLPRSLTLLSALDHTSPCSRVLWTEGDSYVHSCLATYVGRAPSLSPFPPLVTRESCERCVCARGSVRSKSTGQSGAKCWADISCELCVCPERADNRQS